MFRTEKKLILASGSPRRKTLLTELGIDFVVAVPDIDESRHEMEVPHAYVLRMASDKGESVARSHPAAWVLSADTICSRTKDGACVAADGHGLPARSEF